MDTITSEGRLNAIGYALATERKVLETIVPRERLTNGEVVSAAYVDGLLNRLEATMDAGDTSFREEKSHIVTPEDYIDHESEPLLLNPCAICGSDAVLYERNDDYHGIAVCSNPRCANHYRYDRRNALCKAVTDWNGLNAGHGVIYREHRGGLEESMRTARVFPDFNALCAYLVDLNNNSELKFPQISKGDITFSLYDDEDERIGWKGVLIVGTKTDSRKSGVTGFASTVWDMNRYYAWLREKGIHQ